MEEFEGKVAVVTGGGSGFGRAIGARCAARGFDVALLDIDGERAATEAEAIARECGVRAIGLRTDVGDAVDVEKAAGSVAEELGGADLVFSNVGVQQIGAFERFADEAWTWMLDVNVVGSARDGIGVSVIFPSAMAPRHLESSLAARPNTIVGEIAPAEDIEAVIASNASFSHDVATAEEAARYVVDDVLAGDPYITTHGDLVDAVTARQAEIRHAVERVRARSG